MKFHDDNEVQWERLHEYLGDGMGPCQRDGCGAEAGDDRVHLYLSVVPMVLDPLVTMGGGSVTPEECARSMEQLFHMKRRELYSAALKMIVFNVEKA